MKVLRSLVKTGLDKIHIIKRIQILVFLCFIISFCSCERKKSQPDTGKTGNYLEVGFKDPPKTARPRAYWAWVNGNVNMPQLTRELEEYKDKGLAGVDIFDIGAVDPNKVVPEGNKFLGKESVDAIVYAVNEAKRVGLELGLVASSSWNAGGDWVTPEYAAMLLYKSDVVVEGPFKFAGILPFPEVSEHTPKKANGLPVYYKSVATIAFPVISGNLIPDKSNVVDLTEQIDSTGKLKWKVPAGRWKIMRLVCSNSGQKLVLPSPKSSGYNIDHFNPKATEMHFQYIIDRLQKELGDFSNTALKFMYLCSYELQGLVWTPEMLNEFQQRRGYNMTPFLPILYGNIIENKEISERFMFDFNMTLSDLIIEGHYMKARSLLNKYGLKLCSEAGGPGQPLHNCPFEALRALGALDVPRGEFWNKHHYFDEKGEDILWLVKEISCASHIYGKTIVDGEAFTSWQHWQEGPLDLKPLADKAMCEGLNRFTFHTGTHNPPEGGKPGWVYHAGTHMNPNRVWWPKIKPFIDYLARSCFLLQQGKFVGDVCYYYGDKAPNFVKPKHIDPSLGYGFDYDVVNTEVILSRMNTANGKIVLPDGLSYELLVLPDREHANPQVLTKLMDLVKEGATVVGPKPTRSNGLTDYPHPDEKVKMLADKLWGPCNGKEVKENSYGKGKVIWGKNLKEILAERGIGPDFIYVGKNDSTDLDYIHRSTEREEIYFVSNKKMQWAEAECEFRVKNKVPELWSPETGKLIKNLVYKTDDQITRVFLQLPPSGSVFVVFRGKSDKKHIVSITKDGETIFPVEQGTSNVISPVNLTGGQTHEANFIIRDKGTYTLNTAKGKRMIFKITDIPSPMTLSGSWDVSFPSGWGAPPSAVFPELISWTSNKEEGIKYFSGIATYRKEFDLPGGLLNPDNLLYLDLGKVKMIADVYLNDKHLGILWEPPFQLDITNSIKPGNNKLVIEVANDWSNRIVGDQKLPRAKRFTSTNITSPNSSDLLWKDAPLLESGLIGPVQIIGAKKITLFKNAPAQTQISGTITTADNNDFIRSSGSNSGRTDRDPITTPLKALSTNPNYFTNSTGKAIYLTGSHTWNTLQDWGTNDSIEPLDFNAFVGLLVAHHHNFTLLWTTELPIFRGLPTTKDSPPDFSVTPFPWQRTGPGNGSDGKPKFDLTKFNQLYFDRLHARVRKLNEAGIYAGVYLFSGEWIMRFRFSSDGYPFTGSNNVNGIDDGGGTGSVTMTSPNKITAVQDTYVEKVINTLNDLPNVLWIVSQEAPLNSEWWNDHLIAFVRSYEAGMQFQHPIGFGVPDRDLKDSIIINSDADWIAPGVRISPTQTIGTGNPARKVNINDSDHSYWEIWKDPPQANRNYFWINFTQGNQTLFMDPYVLYYPRERRNLPLSPRNGIGSGPDRRWENVRNTMGYIRDYADHMNLAAMTPQGKLSTTGHALANAGPTNPEFLVYSSSGGEFTVNLSAIKGQFTVEWLNPSTGVKIRGSDVNGEGARTFTPPFSGDAVLYLRRSI